MAKDHYIAQTYLKHFGDASQGGMLHGYKKSDGATFKCWPKDVCHEWDGDLNPAIVVRPELLGDFRKIFEPHWNPSIANILVGKISANDKFVASAYMANMMVCTPAWRRVAEAMYAQHAAGYFSFSQRMNEKHGVKDELLAEGVQMLQRGELKLEANADYIKALITRQLLAYACLTYNLDLLLVENSTDIPFLTSDNPVAVDYSGRPGAPVTRMLPITPSLCLSVTYDPAAAGSFDMSEVPRIMKTPPTGIITRAKVKPAGVRTVNRLIAQCAENLVFASRDDTGAAELVKKYGKFRIEADFVELEAKGEPDAVY